MSPSRAFSIVIPKAWEAVANFLSGFFAYLLSELSCVVSSSMPIENCFTRVATSIQASVCDNVELLRVFFSNFETLSRNHAFSNGIPEI